jgi:hypothetical protein
MPEQFHDFDPYRALEEITILMKQIADAHNLLVKDHVQIKGRVELLERRIRQLEKPCSPQ